MAAIDYLLKQKMGFPVGSNGKESACNAGGRVQSLGWEDTLDKGMATHSSILAGEFHGHRGLVGYISWSHKEVDMTVLSD